MLTRIQILASWRAWLLAWLLLVDGVLNAPYAGATAFVCPRELADATQLLLITTPGMSSHQAHLRSFERDSAASKWRMAGEPLPAVVGKNGLGWSKALKDLVAAGKPFKVEGDGRTPAGVFRLGNAFGFDPSSVEGYVRLILGRHFCVDDPTSPLYNKVISVQPRPSGLKGEEMGSISLYRKGFFVEYPTNAAARAGSCIFLHVWRSPTTGTNGCVALAQSTVERLQDWVRPKGALIAILPAEEALHAQRCLNINGETLKRRELPRYMGAEGEPSHWREGP